MSNNSSSHIGDIFVGRLSDATQLVFKWKKGNYVKLPYTKYNIRETDFRVKTATFSSPQFFDLTTGKYAIKINSLFHENFAGTILDVNYDETTGMYDYQCQDWSRTYISTFESIKANQELYRILQQLITRLSLSYADTADAKKRKKYSYILSGLDKKGKYDQSLYSGNRYAGNPMTQRLTLISRNKSFIEVIRSLVFSRLGYFDIWFNDNGVLQITPLSKTDWENTGLHLGNNEFSKREFKFSTTNAITGVKINGGDEGIGTSVKSQDVIDLDLSAFFGKVTTSIDDPNKNSDTTNAVKSSSKTSNKNTKTATKTTTNKYANPFNKKKKKAWINADNGSNAMKNALIKALRNDGWSVHDGGTWSNAHIQDVFKVTSAYSVYITLYNGFCAGTVREAYSNYVQNPLRKKGVQLVPIWDSHDWTNPKGMKPYRYGDFSKYSAKRAWDDNFSSSNPAIRNVGDFFKKNKATYCVGPTVADIMKQFRKGGYFKYKGIKV